MKGLQVIIIGCLAAAALSQETTTPASTNSSALNTRFFGGSPLGGLGGGLNPALGGISGINPGFGGIGGINPELGGIGGINPGFGGIGGINPGLGGIGGINPGFGGIGGVNPGIGGGFIPSLGSGIGVSQTCRYWCRTPQGQAYCCEDNNQPQGPVGVKPGFCPPVRPQCPPVRNFAPPLTCSNDYACTGVDKCCFDTCLQEHVCKPPIGSSGFGGGFPGGFGR